MASLRVIGRIAGATVTGVAKTLQIIFYIRLENNRKSIGLASPADLIHGQVGKRGPAAFPSPAVLNFLRVERAPGLRPSCF
jgi:hypothetical protein